MTQQEMEAVEQAIATSAAQERAGEGVRWPEGYETWTHEQRHEWIVRLFLQDRDYAPTAEELEVAKHFLRKQESASSMNQRDPNAESPEP